MRVKRPYFESERLTLPLPSVIFRILRRCKMTKTGCWVLISGYKDQKGYGQVWYKKRAHWCHRLTYAFFVRGIPDKVQLHHRCNNPSCVNPYHISMLTGRRHAKISNQRKKAIRVAANVPF